jgi:hypothetical protein
MFYTALVPSISEGFCISWAYRMYYGPFFLPGGFFYPLILFSDIAFGSSFDCLQRLEDRGWFSHGLMYVKTSLP